MLNIDAVSVIIVLGTAAILGSVLVKGIDEIRRGLFCWTVSSLDFVICAVVFFSRLEGFSFNFPQLAGGLCSLLICILLALAAEIISPSKRLRHREKNPRDTHSGERSFNFVAVIICAVLAAMCGISATLQATSLVVLGVVPAAAISLRQLSYYLSAASSGSQSLKDKEQELIKRLMTDDKRL